MLLVKNEEKLLEVINKYELNSIFSQEIMPFLELHMFKKNEHICFMNEELNYLYFLFMAKQKYTKPYLMGSPYFWNFMNLSN